MNEENTHTTELRGDAGSPLLLTVREAYLRLRISKWKLYDLIRSRLLESVQIGRRRFIPADALRTYVQRLSRESLA
ncbi:helix-turn-helix domain-containing protein [Streptomyces adelaidensis]|uniref:helix-turn-helix domain-containing protein n=1 Tax=Streptomyces adelaidensis TaxID=2796465 RepID=UPI00190319E0|nr:helix-turn-helix domain-containing protein [Streptomyces adelaidensis]